ncbi:phosphoenolpyruvate synthase [Chloroflexota bacterium]
MSKGHKAILWFDEVTKDDIPVVGGKGANLGEMTNNGIPVPPGFNVTATAYYNYVRKTGIQDIIRGLLKGLDVQDSKRLQAVAEEVQQVVLDSKMPAELAEEIKAAYIKMGEGLVAVRSSATAEDLPEASFAGQQATLLNIQGPDNVVEAVQRCWASLWEARAIYYREEQGFDHFLVGIAIPIQRMVQAESSGVMFTIDPNTSDTKKVVIEAILGLGEMIVSGDVTPDLYVVDKETREIIRREIKKQEWKLVRDSNVKTLLNNKIVVLTPTEQQNQKVSDVDLLELVEIGIKLEKHYNIPQDIEWAKENGKIYILQTRPVTTISEHMGEAVHEIDEPTILTGSPASPGVASGRVKIVPDPSYIDKVMEGDILVAEMTTPDFVPAMKRAAAIVTDRGGRTAHAAIVSRELGIPCVVGAVGASAFLKDGQVITVDGYTGNVYGGKVDIQVEVRKSDYIDIETKTKLLVNLAQPEIVDQVAGRNVDGVGLLRAEFIVAQIGEHPSHMIAEGRGHEFVDKLAEGLLIFAKAFYPRRVVYRTTDFKSNEYRALKGGAEYEEDEENPMIGYRGASRYITDVETFKLELEAIKKVREEYNNLWIMIPFVRTVNELERTVKIIEGEGLKRSDDFKLWMMVEVPSNVFLLDKFIDVGIDGISIGTNDLTQLILGVDRDSAKLAETFDERNEAVVMALEMILKTTKEKGITSSICGQAPSVYPELTEKLVSWGITSISVSPDMIDVTREIIAKAEERLNK